MNTATTKRAWVARLATLSAAFAAVVASQAQVTFQTVTNGLVDLYPLDIVATNGGTVTTPDYLGGRDMILNNMTGANLIPAGHPTLNSASTNMCLNFTQSGGATLIYYASKGQNAVTGGGDFLPFCNQLNATMNFWIKAGATTGYNDTRFFGECDNSSGQSGPIVLWGTSSGGGLGVDTHAHFLFRASSAGSGPQFMPDGTQQLPFEGYFWQQGSDYTAGNPLDASWHMMTMTIDTNRVIDIYIDGVRDAGTGAAGGTSYTDANGNANWGPDMPLTNLYYTTNLFPGQTSMTPPPNGYVRWMWPAINATGNTVFGGFKRNGSFSSGIPCQIDDIAFWSRKLNSNEIAFVFTNGLPGIQISRPLVINSFAADLPEVGKGDTVTLRWNVTGANTSSGGLIISGVGDVSSKGLVGSTNVTVNGSQTFTLTAHNGIAADVTALASVKTFAGVDSSWHLIQRFDGVFANTFSNLNGISGNDWVSDASDYRGAFNQFNVFTSTVGGGSNEVLTPRSGYLADANSPSGFDSHGAAAYGTLGSLAMTPGQTRTLFFRFSLQESYAGNPNGTPLWSDIDFNTGITDSGLIGPFGTLNSSGQPYTANIGPQLKIYRSSGGLFDGSGKFSIYAGDYNGTNLAVGASFDYLTAVDANGLQTNENYNVWMTVTDDNTHLVVNGDGTSNDVQLATYSVWLQKQGSAPTNLFSNYHGNRDYVDFNLQDIPSTTLNKVFVDIGDEDITAVAPGAYIGTNMIAVDDFYISKSGADLTVPRLFDITSVTKDTSGVTIKWDSLGSLWGTNTYTIQRTTSLTNPSWNKVGQIPSGGASTSFTDATAGADTSFYRISWP